MTNRNEIPFSSNLESELQNSARLIALAYADLIMRLSDSSLDESYAMTTLLTMLTDTIYCNDQTTDLISSFNELCLNDEFLELNYNTDMTILPIAKYFDFD